MPSRSQASTARAGFNSGTLTLEADLGSDRSQAFGGSSLVGGSEEVRN